MIKRVSLAAIVLALALPAFADYNNLMKFNGGMRLGNYGTRLDTFQMGTVTLVAGVGVVTNAYVKATTNIFVQRQTNAGTVGVFYDVTRTAGTSFTITARSAPGTTQTADTSVVAWWFVEPMP